jgi:hypothetical protein
MLRDWLASATPTLWPVLAMGLFLTVFLAILVRLGLGMRDRDEEARVARLARLPLENDAAGSSATGREVQPT